MIIINFALTFTRHANAGRARRQLLFNKTGGRRSFRQLERLVSWHCIIHFVLYQL